MASITAKDVSLVFPVMAGRQTLRKTVLRASVGGLISRNNEDAKMVYISALKDISLSLNDGDRIGLIGPNGAGKSTLLKVLAGIYEPTEGSVKIEGKVSALFQPGMGMDPDDDGYQNIFNCGLYLGHTYDEIESIIPEIEEFTELGEYLSLPVRTYSSGMMLRLSFAITTTIEPEILLLDEGLGAGDARFAQKVKKRMEDFLHRASILCMASHGTELLLTLCNKGLLLDEGHSIAFGSIDDVVKEYKDRVKHQV